MNRIENTMMELIQDELQQEDTITTIYEYDPNTGLCVSISQMILEDGSTLPENSTLVPQPDYDIRTHYLRFDVSKNKWISEELTSPLDELKISAKSDIDLEVNRLLKKIITFDAQATGLYDLKYAESIKFIESGQSDASVEYPFLQTEAQATGKSAIECANIIIDKRNEYVTQLNEIEKIRISAKASIDAVNLSATVNIDAAHSQITEITRIATEQLFNLI